MNCRSSDDRGEVALEWALGTTLILLPTLVLVTLVPVWVERQSMARVAALQAAQVAIIADDLEVGPAVAAQVAANHGAPAGDLTVTVAGSLERDGSVTATAVVHLPVLRIPLIGDFGGANLTHVHTQRVDLYRSDP